MKKQIIRNIVIGAAVLFAGGVLYNTNSKLGSISEKLETLESQEIETEGQNEKDAAELTGSLSLKVNGEELKVSLNKPGSVYDCTTLNTEFPIVFETDGEEPYSIVVQGEELKDGTAEVKLSKLSHSTRIKVIIDGNIYWIRTLPEEFPKLTAKGESAFGGYYYTAFTGYIVKLDAKGNIVFYKAADTGSTGVFRRNEIDGEVFYSYLELKENDENPSLTGVSYLQTKLMILDEQYREVDSILYMNETEKVPSKYSLENHDYQILGKNHYILSTYLGKRVYNIPEELDTDGFGANVAACIFQEVKDGNCIFEWDSTDFPELYGASQEAGDYTNKTQIWSDYVHLNSISIDPRDGNFICSFRNLDAVLKISRETGEILWTLGGVLDDFGITKEQQFYRQHHATICEDGSLLLFDNHCEGLYLLGYPEQSQEEVEEWLGKDASRICRFYLDEETKKIASFKEYSRGEFFSPSMGNVQVIDEDTETYLIGWGGKTRAGMPLFEETNFRDETVDFELYADNTSLICYRTAKYDQ